MTIHRLFFFVGALYSLAAVIFWHLPPAIETWILPTYIITGVCLFYVISTMLRGKVETLIDAVKRLPSDMTTPLPLTEDKSEMGELARLLEESRKVAVDQAQKRPEEVLEIETLPSKSFEPVPISTPVSNIIPVPDTGNYISSSIVFDFKKHADESCNMLRSVAESVQEFARGMSELTHSSKGNMDTVSSAAEESSMKVQAVASAAEQLSVSIAAISRQVMESANIARQASQAAEETDARVNGLASAASKINDVVQLIQDIANQTHLLALNATIEAARAGEAGKGFAVVASEVKNLANQTAKATDDISDQIEQIQLATQDTVNSIRAISEIIHQVNETANGIASSVEEQTAATRDIAAHVQQVFQGTQRVSEKIIDVEEMTSESGAKSDEIARASMQIVNHATELQKQLGMLTASMNQG